MTKNLSEILVVSDVDGTLLQAGFGIPRENIETIERFVERGGRFTLATGRGIASVAKYTDWIPISAPAILVNGGIIYDYGEKRILHEYTLDPGARAVLREIMDVFPLLGVELLIREECVALRMNQEVMDHTALEHIPFALTDIDTANDGWNKVLFADKPDVILLVKEYVEQRMKHDERFRRYDFVQTSQKYYELIPKGINKADGLERLSEKLGVDLANTVAIGDYYNDIELLDMAGYAVCVADAPEEVQKHADRVVGTCLSGGVADVLNQLMEQSDR